MAHSTGAGSGAKSRKKFPLWTHATGQWAKKVRGKTYYFGTDPDEALKEYLRVKDDLEAGRRPRPAEDGGRSLKGLCNHFLTHKRHQVETGELALRTFEDYFHSCELMLKHLGKELVVEEIRPEDLMQYRRTLAATRNATSLGNEVNRTRVILRFAFENMLIDRPVRFGDFKRPAKRVVRKQRAQAGPRLFSSEAIRKMIDAAEPQMTAMILLAINGGLGNADVGQLPKSAFDLSGGWLDYPRPKTGIGRRIPLWTETVKAVESVIETVGNTATPLLFITRYGQPWHIDGKPRSAVSAEFRKLVRSIDDQATKEAEEADREPPTPVYRKGFGFYTLRHCFQTIGDQTGDYLSVRHVMGHADNTMSGNYREEFDDRRLRAVVDHVHSWLYGGRGDE